MTSADQPSQTEKPIRLLKLGAAVSSVLIFTSGCVVISDDPTEDDAAEIRETPEPNEAEENGTSESSGPLASSITTSTDLGSDLQIDIQELSRLPNGIIKLDFNLINNSAEDYMPDNALSDEERYAPGAITLIDSANQQRLLSYEQSDGTCFCKSFEGTIPSGSSESVWVAFPEPQDGAEKLTVTTPITPPLLDIPITDSSESLENENLDDERVLDLTMISEDLDDQTGRTESNEEVSILLSSDILFDTESAELNDEADTILEQVAQEIDDVEASEISIDGHADNTGNDSINIPLSEERAESVESALAGMVTREGITFEVEGHGSAEPIADNETEEGRERNRRVSVTFEP